MKTCVILCAMPVSDYEFVQPYVNKADLLIAADGGVRHAQALGTVPDIILGDFDSWDGDLPACGEVIRLPAEKDDTDTMFAVKLALERGCDFFYLIGALGGRLDHTMANIQTLAYLREHGARGVLLSRENIVFLLKDELAAVPRVPNHKLSVFALSPVCRGINLAQVKYPLREYTLDNRFPLGVSNEFEAEQAIVQVRQGELLVILSENN